MNHRRATKRGSWIHSRLIDNQDDHTSPVILTTGELQGEDHGAKKTTDPRDIEQTVDQQRC